MDNMEKQANSVNNGAREVGFGSFDRFDWDGVVKTIVLISCRYPTRFAPKFGLFFEADIILQSLPITKKQI